MTHPQSAQTVTLSPSGTTLADVVAVARHGAQVRLSDQALQAVAEVRQHVEDLAAGETPPTASPPGSGRWRTSTFRRSRARSCRSR